MRDKLYNYFYEMIAAGTDENYAYARDLLKVLPKLLPHGEDKKRISDQIDSYIKEQCNMLSSLRNLLNFYQKPEDRKHILNEIDFSSIIKSVNDLQEVLLTFPGITDEMRIKIIDSLDFKKIVSNEIGNFKRLLDCDQLSQEDIEVIATQFTSEEICKIAYSTINFDLFESVITHPKLTDEQRYTIITANHVHPSSLGYGVSSKIFDSTKLKHGSTAIDRIIHSHTIKILAQSNIHNLISVLDIIGRTKQPDAATQLQYQYIINQTDLKKLIKSAEDLRRILCQLSDRHIPLQYIEKILNEIEFNRFFDNFDEVEKTLYEINSNSMKRIMPLNIREKYFTIILEKINLNAIVKNGYDLSSLLGCPFLTKENRDYVLKNINLASVLSDINYLSDIPIIHQLLPEHYEIINNTVANNIAKIKEAEETRKTIAAGVSEFTATLEVISSIDKKGIKLAELISYRDLIQRSYNELSSQSSMHRLFSHSGIGTSKEFKLSAANKFIECCNGIPQEFSQKEISELLEKHFVRGDSDLRSAVKKAIGIDRLAVLDYFSKQNKDCAVSISVNQSGQIDISKKIIVAPK